MTEGRDTVKDKKWMVALLSQGAAAGVKRRKGARGFIDKRVWSPAEQDRLAAPSLCASRPGLSPGVLMVLLAQSQ